MTTGNPSYWSEIIRKWQSSGCNMTEYLKDYVVPYFYMNFVTQIQYCFLDPIIQGLKHYQYGQIKRMRMLDFKQFNRKRYLDKLVQKKNNGMVKIITGIRRCGKSFLLTELFHKHLNSVGIPDQQIIELAFDEDQNIRYRNPILLGELYVNLFPIRARVFMCARQPLTYAVKLQTN